MNLQDTAAELVNQGRLPLSAFLRMLNSGKFSSKIENMKKENPRHKVPERKNILKHMKRKNPWKEMLGEQRYPGMVEQMKSKPFQLSEEEFDTGALSEFQKLCYEWMLKNAELQQKSTSDGPKLEWLTETPVLKRNAKLSTPTATRACDGSIIINKEPITTEKLDDWLPKKESDLEYFIRTSILRNSARKKLGWLDG